MHINTLTSRAKKVVRRWGNLPPNNPLLLEHELLQIRDSDSEFEILRGEVNFEFHDENNLPVSKPTWVLASADFETVRDLRDWIKDRIGGEG